MGPFKYYIIKEVGGWGQNMAIFDDLQYCKSSTKWVGGPKKSQKHDDVILEWSLTNIMANNHISGFKWRPKVETSLAEIV